MLYIIVGSDLTDMLPTFCNLFGGKRVLLHCLSCQDMSKLRLRSCAVLLLQYWIDEMVYG